MPNNYFKIVDAVKITYLFGCRDKCEFIRLKLTVRFLNEIMYDCQGWIVRKTKKNIKSIKQQQGAGKQRCIFESKKKFCYGWGEDFWTCMYLSE